MVFEVRQYVAVSLAVSLMNINQHSHRSVLAKPHIKTATAGRGTKTIHEGETMNPISHRIRLRTPPRVLVLFAVGRCPPEVGIGETAIASSRNIHLWGPTSGGKS